MEDREKGSSSKQRGNGGFFWPSCSSRSSWTSKGKELTLMKTMDKLKILKVPLRSQRLKLWGRMNPWGSPRAVHCNYSRSSCLQILFPTTQIEIEDADSSKSSGAAHVGGGSRAYKPQRIIQHRRKPEITQLGNIPKEIETLIKKLRIKLTRWIAMTSRFCGLGGESVYYGTHQFFLTSRQSTFGLSPKRDPWKVHSPWKSKESSSKLKRSREQKLTSTI